MDNLIIVDQHNTEGETRKIVLNRDKIVSIIPNSTNTTDISMENGQHFTLCGSMPDIFVLLRHSKFSAIERKAIEGLQSPNLAHECLQVIRDIIQDG